ncbi:hypothetical protein AYO37_00555 [Opitutia bacterium SCGC AG-212-L18]|nr:hypothetical protein AYO37_00555 [Opitutae bacterium SCGC AG-212-L18]
MKKINYIITLLILTTISHLAFANDAVKNIQEAIKNKDLPALESILKHPDTLLHSIYEPNFKSSWDFLIKEALEAYPEAVLLLWEFSHEHCFSLQYFSQIHQEEKNPDNLSLIIKLNNEKISLGAIKYYNLIKKYYIYDATTEVSDMNFLNLLLKNGMDISRYIKAVHTKIDYLATNNNIDGLKKVLENLIFDENDIKTWESILNHNSISYKYSSEAFSKLIQFAKNKNMNLFRNKENLAYAISKSSEENALFLINQYPDIIKTINKNDYTVSFYLTPLSPNNLDQLLASGLNMEAYAEIILRKIETVIKNKDKKTLEVLLNRIEITKSSKAIWEASFSRYAIGSAVNSFPEIIPMLLQFGEQKKFDAVKSYQLAEIIRNCDEETALFTIQFAKKHCPNELESAKSMLLFTTHERYDNNTKDFVCDAPLPTKLIIELYNDDYEPLFTTFLKLDNAPEILEEIMQKDPSLTFLRPAYFEFFLTNVIQNNRFDILEILSQYGLSLETITTSNNIDTHELLCAAVLSTEEGNHKMFDYVLDTLKAHQHPIILACAARLKNNALFNDLLEKGYTADPDPEAESNITGLAFALESGNFSTIDYYLKLGTDPNQAVEEEGIYHLFFYFSPNNPDTPLEKTQRLELLDHLITQGLKINLLNIADCAQSGSLAAIQYLKNKGYNTKHPGIFVAACQSGNRALIDFLLEDGANIKDPNALVSAVRSDNIYHNGNEEIKTTQYLIEKGANPNNLMALNEALKTTFHELKLAKYLVEQGAKVEPRCILSAGLTGNSMALKWTFEQTNTPITAELENIINSSKEAIIQYTLKNLVPKNSILIGIANFNYHFTDGIGSVASKLMEQNPDVFVVPLTPELTADDAIMIRFSGFINPGAGDSYPRLPTFSIKDIDENRMDDHEKLYQQVISFAKKHDIPYLGICLGSQYLVLNSEGYLQPVKGHGNTIAVHFEKGSIPHFMTLLPQEKAKALQECLLNDITAQNADVTHDFAAVKNQLGNNIKLGALSGKDENVPEAVSHGHNQIGVQFHPERGYFRDKEGEINRQKLFLDNFFENALNYQKSRTYALECGLHYTEVKDNIANANQKLLNHLESCAHNPLYSRNHHFWGKNLGSYTLPADNAKNHNNETVNILTGLTPKDVALARNGDDLILIIKNTGEMLSIESHFAENSEHRVKSIDFADGSKLIFNNNTHTTIEDGRSEPLENLPYFYRNATALN